MNPEQEHRHARWHSRAGFLATTLLVLFVMGAPMLVTRGILSHGTLFLPVVGLLVALFGGPLIRLALATGRLDHRAPGREALLGVQALIRLVIAVVLIVLAARAGGWLVSARAGHLPDGLLDYQARELTPVTTAWHEAWTTGAWAGLGLALILTGVLTLFARRRRLAGLSWLAGWLLGLVAALLLLGLAVGYSMPGAGALAALSAPVRWPALASVAFWGDAAAVAMLALGAQTGVVSAAGRGLPKRAGVGREARILVAGMAFLVVLTGLCGLLLTSALCHLQGVVPGPEHAAPGVLTLDLVPALGETLFASLPEDSRPTRRHVTLGWAFIVMVACSFGAAAMLGARRLIPRGGNDHALKFGHAAALVVLVALVVSLAMKESDAYLPLLTVMPALLAVIRVTLARRAGAGMRVVSVAFHDHRPWVERAYLVVTFRVVRPLLLLAVLAVALTRREYSIMLASFAVAFALMWVGSLSRRVRNRETGLIRAAGLVALFALAVPAQAQDGGELDSRKQVFLELMMSRDADARRELRSRFELEFNRAHALRKDPDDQWYRRRTLALLELPEPPWDTLRDVNACLALLAPQHEDTMRLERAILMHDGVAPFPRLDEALIDYAAGDRRPLLRLAREINGNINGPRLAKMLQETPDAPVADWKLAIVGDLSDAYGTAPPRTRELRRYIVQQATEERTLLKPDPAPGITYLLCLLFAAGGLAAALMTGFGRPRR